MHALYGLHDRITGPCIVEVFFVEQNLTEMYCNDACGCETGRELYYSVRTLQSLCEEEINIHYEGRVINNHACSYSRPIHSQQLQLAYVTETRVLLARAR